MLFHFSDAFIDSLILEDCPNGDLTTGILDIENMKGELLCSPKARQCVLAGVEIACRIFEHCGCQVKQLARDGDFLEGCPYILSATGSAAGLHRGWKIAQNTLEYMSGIATRTRNFCLQAALGNPNCSVAVTRKNFPGTKLMSLASAIAGGATIHRAGLSESVLIFDRHTVFLDAQEPLGALVHLLPQLKQRAPEKRLTAEVSTESDALRLAKAGVDCLQLEKFTPEALRDIIPALRKLNSGIRILAAGGINADNAQEFAASGADVLVTSWVYFGKPQDIQVTMRRIQ